MAAGRRSRIDEEFLRAIAATSPAAAALVENYKATRKRGRQPIPEIARRQLARMWKSYRRLHKGTDEDLAYKFFHTHKDQIEKLGFKIERKTYRKWGPWTSLRTPVGKGTKASGRIESRRKSTWQFMGRAFGRQKSSFRVIRLGLARQKLVVDRATAEYLLAAEAAALSDQRNRLLSLGEYLLAQEEKPTAFF